MTAARLFTVALCLVLFALLVAQTLASNCQVCNNAQTQAFINQCYSYGGRWCACAANTPDYSCGSCINIGGNDPNAVCINGLACGGGMSACVGQYGASCYGTWSSCNCYNGRVVCGYGDKSPEGPEITETRAEPAIKIEAPDPSYQA